MVFPDVMKLKFWPPELWEKVSIVLSYPVCGHLLWRPNETVTAVDTSLTNNVTIMAWVCKPRKVQEDFLSFFDILSQEHLTLFQWLHFCHIFLLVSLFLVFSEAFQAHLEEFKIFLNHLLAIVLDLWRLSLLDQDTILASFSVIFALWPRLFSFLISIFFSISCREWYEMNGCTCDNKSYLPSLPWKG